MLDNNHSNIWADWQRRQRLDRLKQKARDSVILFCLAGFFISIGYLVRVIFP